MSTMMRAGLDISKNIFQVYGVNDRGDIVIRRKLRRSEVLEFFEGREPCVVGIEACATSHYWARALTTCGHQVKLVPAGFVKPFVKSQKNDAADAEAICEAISRPHMRFVPSKSLDQQAIMSVHRMRNLLIRQRVSLTNALRAHIAEYGHITRLGKLGVEALRGLLKTDNCDFIPAIAKQALQVLSDEIGALSDKTAALERVIEAWHRSNPDSQRLATIPGIGPLAASALAAAVPDPTIFKSGKGLAAWLGLVPKQHSSGGKPVLGGITKRGDKYIRQLLVHGACNVLIQFRLGRTRVPRTIGQLLARKRLLVVAVAFANKIARTVWAVLSRGSTYHDPSIVTLAQISP